MNILFVLGNGFDINLGMKTKYTDFYKEYKISKSQGENIENLKSTIITDNENWADLELALGEFTSELESEEDFDEVNDDLRSSLAKYLEKQETNFDYNKFDKKKLFRCLAFPEEHLLLKDQRLVNTFKKGHGIRRWNVNILTLNYTNSIEKLVGDKNENIEIFPHQSYPVFLNKIEHMHGYTDNRMVLGVNDISQIGNSNFHGNNVIKSSLIKKNCNQAGGHLVDEWCEARISESQCICLFGSSIGKTDIHWWRFIANHLYSKDCRLIIFSKIDKVINPMDIHKIQAHQDQVRELFIERSGLTESVQKKIRDKIFVGINTDMFKLN